MCEKISGAKEAEPILQAKEQIIMPLPERPPENQEELADRIPPPSTTKEYIDKNI
ncbi:MAG: hypothetical protein M1120_02100 [Patescibacteria group bacterium]|nr:hypothetical protein [Patescibacteria group bacterium]